MGLIVIDDWLLLTTLPVSQRMQDEPRGSSFCSVSRLCGLCSMCPIHPLVTSRNTNWPKCASRAFIVHLAIILCNLFSFSLIELNLQNLQLPATSPTRAVPQLFPWPLSRPPWEQLLLWQAALSWYSPHKSMSRWQMRYLYPPALICLMCIHGTVSGHQSCCTRF